MDIRDYFTRAWTSVAKPSPSSSALKAESPKRLTAERLAQEVADALGEVEKLRVLLALARKRERFDSGCNQGLGTLVHGAAAVHSMEDHARDRAMGVQRQWHALSEKMPQTNELARVSDAYIEAFAIVDEVASIANHMQREAEACAASNDRQLESAFVPAKSVASPAARNEFASTARTALAASVDLATVSSITLTFKNNQLGVITLQMRDGQTQTATAMRRESALANTVWRQVHALTQYGVVKNGGTGVATIR